MAWSLFYGFVRVPSFISTLPSSRVCTKLGMPHWSMTIPSRCSFPMARPSSPHPMSSWQLPCALFLKGNVLDCPRTHLTGIFKAVPRTPSKQPLCMAWSNLFIWHSWTSLQWHSRTRSKATSLHDMIEPRYIGKEEVIHFTRNKILFILARTNVFTSVKWWAWWIRISCAFSLLVIQVQGLNVDWLIDLKDNGDIYGATHNNE